MRKLRLLLVFVIVVIALFATSCTDMSALGLGARTCSVHRDLNKDGVCDACGSEMPYECPEFVDLDHDGYCDNEDCEEYMEPEHVDKNHDGVCDSEECGKTGLKFEHTDINKDKICDVCKSEIIIECECYDNNEDFFCDECGYQIIICKHPDKNKDEICDDCGESLACIHRDSDKNGTCEVCKQGMPGTIPFINGEGGTQFMCLIGSDITGRAYNAVDDLIEELQFLNVDIGINDSSSVVFEYEILFGDVSRRDDYKIDIHQYGLKGYVIKIIDKKIIVYAGSEASYIEAISVLRNDFFGITDRVIATGTLTNVNIYSDKQASKVQDDYAINLITLFGNDIRDYTISYNDKNLSGAATKLQALLYEKAGYWLPDVQVSEPTEKTIYLGKSSDCGEKAFSVDFANDRIVFLSEYNTTLGKVPYDFFVNEFVSATEGVTTLALSDESESYPKFARNAHYVYYDDFGAVGDGITNDADAIYEAHKFAASGNHKKIVALPAEAEKPENNDDVKITYLIGEIAAKASASITCDVDWTGVKFIIDDREGVITNGFRESVFKVNNPGGVSYTVSTSNALIKQINANGGFKATEIDKFDLGIGHAAMIFVSNSGHKYFIREGVNSNDGTSQKEMILVDAEGNIDPKVRFLFDYEKITGITVYRVDTETVKPITIEGGHFTTRAHNQTTSASYTGQRGITVLRCHTTIKNLEHYVVGEVSGDKGSAYPNFMDIQNTYNVLVEDCVFTARTTYYNIKGTSKVGQGTYDITTHNALEVTWKNCTQSNFYNDPTDPSKGRPTKYWGINGGGGSKRVTYDGCTLSRFDAHTGIMHAYIINSTVGSVDLTGGGNLHVINSKVYGTPMIRFREDYGAFWIGDVIIKDSAILENNASTPETVTMFNTSWVNHYFGYKTQLPTSIVIDNLRVLQKDEKTPSTNCKSVLFFAASYVSNSDKYNAVEYREKQTDGTYLTVQNKNIMAPPERIIVRNNHAGLKYSQVATLNEKEFFKDTYVVEMPIESPTECTEHIDHDGDFLCDTCWEYLSALICRIHMDTDHDGFCDALACMSPVAIPTEEE